MDSYSQERNIFSRNSKLENTLTQHSNLLEDPIRNGYLLCFVASKIYGEVLEGVVVYPNTIRECKRNLAQAFKVYRNYSDDFPYELLYIEEEILKGCPNSTWQFIEALISSWKK